MAGKKKRQYICFVEFREVVDVLELVVIVALLARKKLFKHLRRLSLLVLLRVQAGQRDDNVEVERRDLLKRVVVLDRLQGTNFSISKRKYSTQKAKPW